jgi:HAMP domain-containing protein
MAADENIILESFYHESLRFTSACSTHIKSYIADNRQMLFEVGAKAYEHVDPIIERGLAASMRLFIGSGQTVNFVRVANITAKTIGDKSTIDEIRSLKKEFNQTVQQAQDSLDRFWNVKHLHIDMNGERFSRYSTMRHSCLAIMDLIYIYSVMEELADILERFTHNYLKPLLVEKGIIAAVSTSY